MDKTAEGHNMLWIDGDKVGLKVIKIMRSMYGDRLVYPVKDFTPPMIPEYYLVIFTIDGEELDISCEFGDYVLASFSDKADLFVEEIEAELEKNLDSDKIKWFTLDSCSRGK